MMGVEVLTVLVLGLTFELKKMWKKNCFVYLYLLSGLKDFEWQRVGNKLQSGKRLIPFKDVQYLKGLQ